MIPSPIHKVLLVMREHGVRSLLMGGQACVLYGAAEFSRDADLVVLADTGNLRRLADAFVALDATVEYVPRLNLNISSAATPCTFGVRVRTFEMFANACVRSRTPRSAWVANARPWLRPCMMSRRTLSASCSMSRMLNEQMIEPTGRLCGRSSSSSAIRRGATLRTNRERELQIREAERATQAREIDAFLLRQSGLVPHQLFEERRQLWSCFGRRCCLAGRESA